jgi:hypothetical protein
MESGGSSAESKDSLKPPKLQFRDSNTVSS